MTTPRDIEQVGAWLREEGRSPLIAHWPRVVAKRLELLDAVRDLGGEQATWSVGDGWTITGILRHLELATAGVIEIVTSLAAGRRPADGEFDADPGRLVSMEATPEAGGRDSELVARLVEQSVHLASLPREIDTVSRVETFPHGYFGELDAATWYLLLYVHDFDHLGQVQAIRASPDFPG